MTHLSAAGTLLMCKNLEGEGCLQDLSGISAYDAFMRMFDSTVSLFKVRTADLDICSAMRLHSS